MKDHIAKFFKFIETKEARTVDFITKLSNPNLFTIAKDELNYYGSLNLSNLIINSLPDDLKVSGDLILRGNPFINSLPDNLHVNGDLDLGHTNINSLPNNLKIGGYLDLMSTKISKLPDNLQVGYIESAYLDLRSTKIARLPKNMQINGYLYLYGTPLAKKYTPDEIRTTIESNGGYINGEIII